jgi:hypothetical protein
VVSVVPRAGGYRLGLVPAREGDDHIQRILVDTGKLRLGFRSSRARCCMLLYSTLLYVAVYGSVLNTLWAINMNRAGRCPFREEVQ